MVKYNRFGEDSSSRSFSRSSSRSRSSSVSSSISSYSSSARESDEYRQAIVLVNKLLTLQSLSTSDSNASLLLQQLKDMYMLMSPEDQSLLHEYLKRNACSTLSNVIPGTVGSQLCGCYLRSSHYRDGKPGCTAGCADSFFSAAKECPDTIIHWAMTSEGPASRVVKQGNSNCRIYVDPGFQASNEQKTEYLALLGCQTISHYDSMTNNSIDSAQPAARPVRISQTTQKTTPVTNNPNGNTTVSTANQESSWSVYIILIIFIILIFIALIFYFYAF